MANERKPIKLLPQPSPRALYICSPNNGKTAPNIDRSTVFAASAEAAYATLADHIIEAWDESKLKEFCDKNSINGTSHFGLCFILY